MYPYCIHICFLVIHHLCTCQFQYFIGRASYFTKSSAYIFHYEYLVTGVLLTMLVYVTISAYVIFMEDYNIKTALSLLMYAHWAMGKCRCSDISQHPLQFMLCFKGPLILG